MQTILIFFFFYLSFSKYFCLNERSRTWFHNFTQNCACLLLQYHSRGVRTSTLRKEAAGNHSNYRFVKKNLETPLDFCFPHLEALKFKFQNLFGKIFLRNLLEEKYFKKKNNNFIFTLTFTYIIGHYNPSVTIIDLVSHTIYVVCVNFIHKWRDLQFKVFSWQFYLLLRVFARNLLRGNHQRNIFSISFLMSNLGLEPLLFV